MCEDSLQEKATHNKENEVEVLSGNLEIRMVKVETTLDNDNFQVVRNGMKPKVIKKE